MKKIILASGSPRRKELLESLGLEFEVVVSDADEHIDETIPGQLVMVLSALKAEAVRKKLHEKDVKDGKYCKEYIIIGADTVVYAKGEILGKPADKEDAERIIRMLNNDTHSVYTGVTIISDKCRSSFYVETKVTVADMSDDEIKEYVSFPEIYDKAGAYGIQGAFARYIEKIDGDYYNVVGLPVSRLYQELKQYI